MREPYVKKVKNKRYKGIYELRIKFANDIARVFYFIYYNQEIVLLHGFVKKTMKIPKKELDRAKRYMNDFVRRSENGKSQHIYGEFKRETSSR